MQSTAADASIDGAPSQPEGEQLAARHDAVLAVRELRDGQIRGWRKYFSTVMNNFLHPGHSAAEPARPARIVTVSMQSCHAPVTVTSSCRAPPRLRCSQR